MEITDIHPLSPTRHPVVIKLVNYLAALPGKIKEEK